jgi:phosphosulfolactate synthase (CoM biosynthesis protein A)
MSQNDFGAWSTDKAKELFSISHKLMEAAKQLSEHHAEELKANMDHAMHLAKVSAQSDFAKLKEIQTQASEEAVERMASYQAKVKGILKQVNKETAEEADKYLDKARTAMHDYLDQASQKLPVGGAELSKLIKDVSDAGAKVYKEGRKMVDDALENAEAQVDEFAKKTAATAKKSAAKSTSAKTSATKTTAAKTTSRKTS